MVKTTKRARKFESKGGAAGFLAKGTITKKGKLRSKKRRKEILSPSEIEAKEARKIASANEVREERERKRDDMDFVGEGNLGDLDMDAFLSSVVEDNAVGGDGGGGDNDDDDEGEEGSLMDDPESDDDSEVGDPDDGSDEDLEAAEMQMEADMAKMAENDPEFHKYLEDNDSSLLQFAGDAGGGDDGEDGEDDGDGSDEEEDGDEDDSTTEKDASTDTITTAKPKPKKPSPPIDNSVLVDAKTLLAYETAAFSKHGIKALKRILSAYRSACHMADASDPDVDNEGRLKKVDRSRRTYHIQSSVVFDRLMVTCLKNCHEEFKYHLLGKGAKLEFGEDELEDEDEPEDGDRPKKDADNKLDADGNLDLNRPIHPRQMTNSLRWPQIKLCLDSFLKSTLHLLSESAKESKLVAFLLQSLSHYLPFLTPFPTHAKSLLRLLVAAWSSTAVDDASSSSAYRTVRTRAFLRIRQLALTQPFPFVETVLKSTYLSYAASAKFANAAAAVSSLLPTLTFMGNCVVELYGLDYASSYQHSFVYIRQLALHLRTAMQKKTPETVRVVYCWQYLHCLKLWTAVLSSSCRAPSTGEDDGEAQLLRSLIYPLVEIIHGVARLVPTARHLPLRLHCVRYLQQLAAYSERYIPTTSLLLESFDLKEVNTAPKRGGGGNNSSKEKGGKNKKGGGGGGGAGDIRGVRLPVVFKLPKVDALRTVEQLDACLGEVFTLLGREVDLYRYSAGLPEFTIRICQRLRKFSKETRNGKYRAYARGCIELCEKHSRHAVAARSLLTEAPCDVKRLEILLPEDGTVPDMGKRYDASIAKEKPFEAPNRPVLSEKARRKESEGEGGGRKETKGDGVEKVEKVVVEKNKRKKRAKKVVVNEADLKNTGALSEKDQVSEGIDWSESEGEDEEEGVEDQSMGESDSDSDSGSDSDKDSDSDSD